MVKSVTLFEKPFKNYLQHPHGQLPPHVLITIETIFPLQVKFSLDFNKN